jgi:hypothetical protein
MRTAYGTRNLKRLSTGRPTTARLAAALACAALTACTQLPNSFRLEQQNEAFSTSQQINTKIDLLWVVDNSASMDTSQKRLREGFRDFAASYLKPTWDIRIAVITTDTFLGHPNWSTYLNGKVPGSVNGSSAYINTGRTTAWVNPTAATWPGAFYDTTAGRFSAAGLMQREMVPAYNRKYSLLESGATATHDGPISALCSEALGYFLYGQSNCKVRDNPATAAERDPAASIARCLDPAQNGLEQCVNTVQNDVIHTGKAVLDTQPPAGTPANQAWIDQLVQDFMINAAAGTTGSGSERGIQSVLQLIADNEKGSSTTKFFRPGSIRGIIFLSDEDDQSMVDPAPGESPFQYYMCDYDQIRARNGANSYCCASGCTFKGQAGVACRAKSTPDGTFTSQVGLCPDASKGKLLDIPAVKAQLDSFFAGLDGAGAVPNYFVSAIIPMTKTTIQALQAARDQDDLAVKAKQSGTILYDTIDFGERYYQLVTEVRKNDAPEDIGTASKAFDIATTDAGGAVSFKPILDDIGLAIITKRGTFTLSRAPTAQEDMIVKVVRADGSSYVIPASQYRIQDKSIVITSLDVILGFASTDSILIDYQPKTAI